MEPTKETYEGHVIELRTVRERLDLRVDDVPVRYGQLPGGLYFLHDYAYDWSDDLMEVVRRYIRYRDLTDEIRRERASERRGR